MTYDVIIRNGLWFDGMGTVPQVRTLGIRDGIVADVSAGPLDETGCTDVIDAVGKWIVPGFIDVHTHYDAEVLLGPGLQESVRHGVTTVLLGNCSLSTVLANRAEGTPSTESMLFLNAVKPSGICLMRCAQSRQDAESSMSTPMPWEYIGMASRKGPPSRVESGTP